MNCRMSVADIELIFGIEIPSYDGCYGKNKDGMTEKQKAFIHALGMNTTGLKYKGQASVVIDCALRRKANDMATIKQIQTIRNLGVKCRKPYHALTRLDASKILSKYLREV